MVENGQVVELIGNKLQPGELIPGGYVFVHGESIGDIDRDIMKERGQLAQKRKKYHQRRQELSASGNKTKTHGLDYLKQSIAHPLV